MLGLKRVLIITTWEGPVLLIPNIDRWQVLMVVLGAIAIGPPNKFTVGSPCPLMCMSKGRMWHVLGAPVEAPPIVVEIPCFSKTNIPFHSDAWVLTSIILRSACVVTGEESMKYINSLSIFLSPSWRGVLRMWPVCHPTKIWKAFVRRTMTIAPDFDPFQGLPL